MKSDFEFINRNSEVVIVVCTALGSTYAEWKPFANSLKETSVLLYDRAGYGKSELTESERSFSNLSNELNLLIQQIIRNNLIILIGHSFGGLVAEQFIRNFSKNVIGSIFLDPATTQENLFKENLTKKELKASGTDKTLMIKQGFWLGKLKLLWLFKKLFKKTIPFYYYQNYDKSTTKQILEHLTQFKTYHAMLHEYEFFKNQELVKNELLVNSFPAIPVRLIKHNSKKMIDEIMEFGALDFKTSEKIDTIWHNIMENHCFELSSNFKSEVSIKSGHYIHLTDFEIIKKHIDEIREKYKVI